MPDNLLLINADGPEHRVGLLESGQLTEFYVERPRERGLAGNLYKGRVIRVLPGMQAAFVDIGIEKAAFLHVDDVLGSDRPGQAAFFEDEAEAGDTGEAAPVLDPPERKVDIQELLKEGQEVIVQVSKDPLGTKGARVTSYVSLPGRHLVFMPTVAHVGISRRIACEKERKRLRDVVEAMRQPDEGFIIRTAADGVPAENLVSDREFLSKLWDEVKRRSDRAKAPALLHADLDLILRCVRDLLSADVERCLVDDPREHERICAFIETFNPQLRSRVELYDQPEPLFDCFGTEAELDRALERKVWLKSGGYLVIDQAEALTAIDVNTGRYVGKRNLEDTITRINLEAVREIALQLRVRNLGGIIIIDFIDMEKEANRQKVWLALVDALRADRARSNVGKISDLCLVEMTRKRTRESLSRTLTQPCHYCDGKGFTKSPTSVSYEILRHLRRELVPGQYAAVNVLCHPLVAELLAHGESDHASRLEERLGVTLHVHAERGFHLEQYDIQGHRIGSGEMAAADAP